MQRSGRLWILGFILVLGAVLWLFMEPRPRLTRTPAPPPPQETFPPATPLKLTYTDAHGQQLPYRLLVPVRPRQGARYPLVITMHGAGFEGTDNEAQLHCLAPIFMQEWVRKQYPGYILSPQYRPDEVWVPEKAYTRDGIRLAKQPSRPTRLLLELLPKVLQQYPIDPDRVYVVGYSLGGHGAWDLLERAPEHFAAGVIISARGDVKQAPHLVNMPLWIIHGINDTCVGVDCARAMVRALRNAGNQPRYLEYQDAGHEVGWRAMQHPDLLPWLYSQRRIHR